MLNQNSLPLHFPGPIRLVRMMDLYVARTLVSLTLAGRRTETAGEVTDGLMVATFTSMCRQGKTGFF